MTRIQDGDEAHRAWIHYKRTGVILPTHQSEIADRIASGAERAETEVIEESLADVDGQRAPI